MFTNVEKCSHNLNLTMLYNDKGHYTKGVPETQSETQGDAGT